MRTLRLAAALVAASTSMAVGSALPAAATPAGDAPCTATALPSLGGVDGEVMRITDSGLLAGGSRLPGGEFPTNMTGAYWTHDGAGYQVHRLPNDPLVADEVLDVNDNDRMVDYGLDPATGDWESFVYDLPTNTWWQLPSLGGTDTEGRRINAAGVVSGQTSTAGAFQAATWNPPYRKVNVLPSAGFGPFAPGINDSGTAVGGSNSGGWEPIDEVKHLAPSGHFQGNAYRWAAGTAQPTRLPAARTGAIAFAINDAGTIVGGGDVDSTTVDALSWLNGVVHVMGGRPDEFTVARGLSQGGWATGDSETDTTAQAFVWTGTGTLQYLPDLTGADGDSNAHAVNDTLRQVGGWATDDPNVRGFGNGHSPATIWQCPAEFSTG